MVNSSGGASSRLPRTEDEVRRLRMVVATVYKMLRRRDYCVAEEWDELNLADFAERVADEGDDDFVLSATKVGFAEKRLMVVFSRTSPFSIRSLKECVEQLRRGGAVAGIIVGQGRVSASARHAMVSLRGQMHLEYFLESDLLVDITEHGLNPEFTVLTADEKEHVMARCCATETQIPRVGLDDPIARYFGLARGQMLKVVRGSETAGRSVGYRIVM